MRNKTTFAVCAALICLATPAFAAQSDIPDKPKPLGLTVAQAVQKFGPAAKQRLKADFARAKVEYPPQHLDLICFKDKGVLILFAKDHSGKMKQVKNYAIVSNSGTAGPKLKEGDLQIPEGFYKVTGLDAMTHMAFWVNYPNAFDKAHARADHRTTLGGYIQVHGGVYSTGCIVVSNEDMAELLTVAYAIGHRNIDLMILPCNLQTTTPTVNFSKQPKWLPELYAELKTALHAYPVE